MASRSPYKKTFVNRHSFEKRLQTMSRESNLPKETVKHLLHYFSALTKNEEEKMTRSLFRSEMIYRFRMLDDCMLDNAYRCFDKNNRGYLTAEDYVTGMGLFLTDDIDCKTRYCFQIYDLNEDGFITKEEMHQWLRTSLIRQSPDDDSDEGVRELVDIIMKKLDCVDHDNKVSFQDFQAAVKGDNLLLESLCSCLPTREYKKAFLLMISGDLKHELRPTGQSVPSWLDAPYGSTGK